MAIVLDCTTVSSFDRRSKIQARSSNGKLGRGNERTNGSEKEWGGSLTRVRFPFDERAWIFDLPAKEETVSQSTIVPLS